MAEENRTSQGVSLPDKHGLGFMGCQALLGKPSAFKSKGTCPPPPARRSPCSLAASGMDHGIHKGLFFLHTGTHDLS